MDHLGGRHLKKRQSGKWLWRKSSIINGFKALLFSGFTNNDLTRYNGRSRTIRHKVLLGRASEMKPTPREGMLQKPRRLIKYSNVPYCASYRANFIDGHDDYAVIIWSWFLFILVHWLPTKLHWSILTIPQKCIMWCGNRVILGYAFMAASSSYVMLNISDIDSLRILDININSSVSVVTFEPIPFCPYSVTESMDDNIVSYT